MEIGAASNIIIIIHSFGIKTVDRKRNDTINQMVPTNQSAEWFQHDADIKVHRAASTYGLGRGVKQDVRSRL